MSIKNPKRGNRPLLRPLRPPPTKEETWHILVKSVDRNATAIAMTQADSLSQMIASTSYTTKRLVAMASTTTPTRTIENGRTTETYEGRATKRIL